MHFVNDILKWMKHVSPIQQRKYPKALGKAIGSTLQNYLKF